MSLDPIGQLFVGRENFLRQIVMSVEKLYDARKPRCVDIGVLEKYFRFRLALKTRDPWLNGPDRVHSPTLKERELIRIRRRHDHDVAAGLSDFESLCLQPSSTRYILGVAELRRRDFLAAKIRRCLDRPIRLND